MTCCYKHISNHYTATFIIIFRYNGKNILLYVYSFLNHIHYNISKVRNHRFKLFQLISTVISAWLPPASIFENIIYNIVISVSNFCRVESICRILIMFSLERLTCSSWYHLILYFFPLHFFNCLYVSFVIIPFPASSLFSASL